MPTTSSPRGRRALLSRRARRARAGLPAVSVQLGHQALQPVPLLARGRRAPHVVGARRERRHHQPRRRRRLPARPVAPPSWLGSAATSASRRRWQRRRRPGVARARRVFPMQADVYARVAFGDQVSLNCQGGVRGVVASRRRPRRRPPRLRHRAPHLARALPDVAPERDRSVRAQSGVSSRPTACASSSTSYFVRRYTGFNLYEETYNLSGGYVADDWEVHVTAFAPPPEASPTRCSRSARAARRRRASTARSASTAWRCWRLQARIGIGQRGVALPGRRHRQAVGRAGEDAGPGRGRRHPPGRQRGRALRPEPVRLLPGRRPSSRRAASWPAWPTSASRRTCGLGDGAQRARLRAQLLPLGALRAGRSRRGTSSSVPARRTTRRPRRSSCCNCITIYEGTHGNRECNPFSVGRQRRRAGAGRGRVHRLSVCARGPGVRHRRQAHFSRPLQRGATATVRTGEASTSVPGASSQGYHPARLLHPIRRQREREPGRRLCSTARSA